MNVEPDLKKTTQEMRELSPSEKKRLQMLFRSALASALVFELEWYGSEKPERHKTDNAGSDDRAQRKHKHEMSILEEINAQCVLIEELGDKDDPSDDRAFTLARSVGKNACGRAFYCLGKFSDAMKALGEAITLMPDFIDPYLNQASIYLKRKERTSPAWTKEAEDNLNQVLSLSPSNQKAHFLMGKLYADPAVGKYQEAKEHLVKADLFAWSYFIHAQILIRQENKLKEAIDQLRRSIALNAEVDFRFAFYVRCILELTKPTLPPPAPVVQPPGSLSDPTVPVVEPSRDQCAIDLLRAAERAAKLLDKEGLRDGPVLLGEVRTRLQELKAAQAIAQDESEAESIP